MRRAILTAFLLVTVVSACGGESQPSASGKWTRHEIRDSSASVAVPEEWKVIDGRNIKTLSVTLTIPRRVQKPVYTTVIPCRD